MPNTHIFAACDKIIANLLCKHSFQGYYLQINPVKPEHLHALQGANCCRLVVDEDDLNSRKKNCHLLVNQFHGNFRSKILSCRKVRYVLSDVK